MSSEPLKVVEGGEKVELLGREISEPPKAPTAVELTARTNELGEQMRSLIVAAKRLPATKALDPHQDPVRSIALAQSHLQTGFMWLRKAIEQPKVF